MRAASAGANREVDAQQDGAHLGNGRPGWPARRAASCGAFPPIYCPHTSPVRTCLPCRLLHEPPNTLELRLLEAECADLKFKLQSAEERAAAERQAAQQAQQVAEAARREAGERDERLAAALGRWVQARSGGPGRMKCGSPRVQFANGHALWC